MHDLNESKTHDPLILAEQCLALTDAIIQVDEMAVKESLQFVLREKMGELFGVLGGE